jgi:hypothetical protein
VEAGVVWGKELYFDATKVEANASLEFDEVTFSLMEHGLEEHLAGIFPEEEQPQEGANTPEITAVGPAGQEGQALSEAKAHRHRWISEAGRQQREVLRWGYTRMADLRMSATDPDTSLMRNARKKHEQARIPGALRGGSKGKARVILDVLGEPRGGHREPTPMLELLFRSRFRWRLRPHSVTGDAAYATIENIAAVEKAGIRAYMVLPKHDERGPLFGKNEFTYGEGEEQYPHR